ncbi:unnamed protein product [marine sediment metagenome]|uniref:Uncharacterized protein n=1 Tax=marine sediment metagenome TaxID=412755 RepID=X0RVC9_9ZZZZ
MGGEDVLLPTPYFLLLDNTSARRASAPVGGLLHLSAGALWRPFWIAKAAKQDESHESFSRPFAPFVVRDTCLQDRTGTNWLLTSHTVCDTLDVRPYTLPGDAARRGAAILPVPDFGVSQLLSQLYNGTRINTDHTDVHR